MKARAALFGLCCLVLAGCGRHVVVERSDGRLDPARSIAIYGDTEWKIVHEPSVSRASERDDATAEAP